MGRCACDFTIPPAGKRMQKGKTGKCRERTASGGKRRAGYRACACSHSVLLASSFAKA